VSLTFGNESICGKSTSVSLCTHLWWIFWFENFCNWISCVGEDRSVWHRIPNNPYAYCFTLLKQSPDGATGYTCRQTVGILAVILLTIILSGLKLCKCSLHCKMCNSNTTSTKNSVCIEVTSRVQTSESANLCRSV